jgi:uncharacterized protein (DUF2384 family)
MPIAAYQDQGSFALDQIVRHLMTTRAEIAQTLGLGRDAVARKERANSPRTQMRLREMLEILNRMEPRMGTAAMAYAWYRSEPLAGFGGLTPMQLVRDGHADWVHDYISSIDHGIFA